MKPTIKIAIPMAGYGTRMRPHTWSKPKPLIKVAGRSVLDFVLDQYSSIPSCFDVEYILIVGPQRDQIEEYVRANHPDKTIHFTIQEEMLGQSHALYQAREHLNGPLMMAFSDTLIKADLGFLENEQADGVAMVKRVHDPRRFGAVELDDDGCILRLIEKPQKMSTNLVAVGFYYFRNGEDLLSAIEEQMRRNLMIKNEYFLADALNIMIEKGARLRVEEIDTWLDTGTPEALFETNRYLLSHGCDNSSSVHLPGVGIIPPVHVHPRAIVQSSVIGPNVSVGDGCVIQDAVLRNSIVDDGSQIIGMLLENSLVGSRAIIEGDMKSVNVGDDTWLKTRTPG